MERRHFTHFDIAGFTFYEGALVFNQLRIGTDLILKRETENKYDAKAVAVYYGDFKLGFIPRGCNSEISKLLEMGYNIFDTRVQRIDQTAHTENQVGVIVFIRKKKEVSEECKS